jgi:hypothetical protein
MGHCRDVCIRLHPIDWLAGHEFYNSIVMGSFLFQEAIGRDQVIALVDFSQQQCTCEEHMICCMTCGSFIGLRLGGDWHNIIIIIIAG